MFDYILDLYVEIFIKGFGSGKWIRLKNWLCIDREDDFLVLYRKTWRERIFSIRPWKAWTTMFTFSEGFDESRAICVSDSQLPSKRIKIDAIPTITIT